MKKIDQLAAKIENLTAKRVDVIVKRDKKNQEINEKIKKIDKEISLAQAEHLELIMAENKMTLSDLTILIKNRNTGGYSND